MQFTLITPKGKVMQFFIKEVADTYQLAFGGVVVTPQILVEILPVDELALVE